MKQTRHEEHAIPQISCLDAADANDDGAADIADAIAILSHLFAGYSKRSKVETTFYRYKSILGPAMRARGLAAQRVEARIGCKVLNRMTELGMPRGERIG